MQSVHNIQELLKVRSDEFKAIADEAWADLIDARSLPLHLRQTRQSTTKNRLRKAYPLPDTFVIPEKNSQTCSKSWVFIILQNRQKNDTFYV